MGLGLEENFEFIIRKDAMTNWK